jgi:NOL1/NOP2/sun family putative RNA methylase
VFECYREIIPEFNLFQKSLRRPLPTHLRVNRLKIEPDRLLGLLEERGIHPEQAAERHDTLYLAPGLDSPGNAVEYFLGYFHPQALTSCLASIALSPKTGAYVLDMCASPGGKTTHLAQLMQNSGMIIANELHPARHIALGHTLCRLGVLNTILTGYPAQEFPLRPRFDRIMADVPCSGEGRFRKLKPMMRYRAGGNRRSLPDLQKKIILRGFDLLKEGGTMLYATCTYNPDENESVVNHLLNNRDAALLPIDVGLEYEPGVLEWGDEHYDPQLRRTARFYPHHINSVGFFMARIGRRK